VLELHEERQHGSFFPLRRIVLGHGFKVFADMIESSRRPPFSRQSEPILGHVEWDARRGQYRLINEGEDEWIALSASGRFSARKGGSVPVQKGCLLRFGEGKRVAFVVEG
jgi:hypothetical protein